MSYCIRLTYAAGAALAGSALVLVSPVGAQHEGSAPPLGGEAVPATGAEPAAPPPPQAAPASQAAPALQAAAAPQAAPAPDAGEPAAVAPPPPAPAAPEIAETAALSPGADAPGSGDEVLHPSARPGVGLVFAGGLHTGLALGVRLGLGDVGVELAGGYQLLLAISDDIDTGDRDVDAGSSAQGSAELYVTPWHPLEKSAIGLKSGYRYNSVLEHGFSVAITFLADLSEELALEGLAGLSIFPSSEGRLRDALEIPSDSSIVYGSSAQYFEYGFELIWYPW
jgi:hypothetical protein